MSANGWVPIGSPDALTARATLDLVNRVPHPQREPIFAHYECQPVVTFRNGQWWLFEIPPVPTKVVAASAATFMIDEALTRLLDAYSAACQNPDDQLVVEAYNEIRDYICTEVNALQRRRTEAFFDQARAAAKDSRHHVYWHKFGQAECVHPGCGKLVDHPIHKPDYATSETPDYNKPHEFSPTHLDSPFCVCGEAEGHPHHSVITEGRRPLGSSYDHVIEFYRPCTAAEVAFHLDRIEACGND